MSVPVVRHMLLALDWEYDQTQPLAPYTLRNLVFRYRPPDDTGYPFVIPDLRLFVLVVGLGYRELWVEVSGPAVSGEDPDPELLAVYGPLAVRLGVEPTALPRGWRLRAVPIPRPGWYNFRLLCEGVVLADEPVYMEDG